MFQTYDEDMETVKMVYFCQTCGGAYGAVSGKRGRCPACGTLLRETVMTMDRWISLNSSERNFIRSNMNVRR